MAWTDRLKQAAYTPAGGVRVPFICDDVQHDFTLSGTAHDFPDATGTLVQRRGSSGRRYPLTCVFTGPDHDLEADLFETAIRFDGVGRLEHPFYGTLNVVPFGDVTRRDDLKTAANQSVFDVVFWDTIGTAYPSAATDGAPSLAAFNEAAAAQFAKSVGIGTESQRQSLLASFNKSLKTVKAGLQTIADASENVGKLFIAVDESINNGINVLVKDPITMANQALIMIGAPARSKALIGAKLNAYENLARQTIALAVSDEKINKRGSNDFHSRDMFATALLIGAADSATRPSFNTKSQALSAAEKLLKLLDDISFWREAGFNLLGEIDTGEQYAEAQKVIALAAGYLVRASFNLKQERRMILDRPRCPIELCAELYGQTDDALDFFAETNALSWDEQLELQRGRQIVYYV